MEKRQLSSNLHKLWSDKNQTRPQFVVKMDKIISEFEVTRLSDGKLYAKNPVTQYEYQINRQSAIKMQTHTKAFISNFPVYPLESFVDREAVVKGYIENDEIIVVPYSSDDEK